MLRLVFLFFFLSGFSALIYEVSWVRQLALALGNTAQATSTVLAVFLGGLALGAYIGGRWADRWKHLALAAYGYLEIGVGISAWIVSAILQRADVLYLFLYQNLPSGGLWLVTVRLIIAIGLLLVPTMLMGATLPALVRYLEQRKQPAQLFSLLYGLNTLGAAAGSLAACFIGFAYIGLQATLLCAAAINCIIGGFSIYLSRRQEDAVSQSLDQTSVSLPAEAAGSTDSISEDNTQTEEPLLSTSTEVGPPSATAARGEHAISMFMLCAIAFLTGVTALSYEVLWTRILRFFVTSVTYSFTIMISMFLLGLAIGSFIYERWSLKSKLANERPLLSFSVVQFVAAAACGASLPFVLTATNVYLPLREIGWMPIRSLYTHPQYQLLYIFLVSTMIILIPAIFIGILFPMIGTFAAKRSKHGATSVGVVYAFNTIGCVCGSLLCGLVLMPSMGSWSAFQLTVLFSAVTGCVAAFFAERMRWTTKIALVIIPIGLALWYMKSFHFVPVDGPGSGRITLAVGEDYTGAMRVFAEPRYDNIQLMLNGSCLATTIQTSRRYMRLLGHLPVLLNKNPENVLVACFGTGTTCGAAALHPEVKRVDLVELSKMVLNAAPLFRKTNFDVLKRPKVVPHINDVRNYLLTTNNTYDVITFEPPPPTEAGIVNLYTSEFYELAAKKLNPNGLMCQWIPMDQVTSKLWKMQIATARTVFPYVSIWLPNTKEAVMMASKEPIKIDFVKMQQRIDESPEVKKSLDDVGLGSAMAIMAAYVGSGEPVDAYIADVPAITDDHPSLEFYLPYAGPMPKELEAEAIGLKQLNEFVAANRHAPGFNESEFARQWRAIHLLREIELTRSVAEADQKIDAATSLIPNNTWLEYVQSHRDLFYKFPGE